MAENMSDIYHCVWIGDKENVTHVKSLGYDAYYTWSLKGLLYSLLGGVYVYNSYPGNVNLYTMGRAKLVNLWHGVALKCIDRQIQNGPTAKYYQSKGLVNEIRYLNFRKHADVVLSTSPLMTVNFSEAFDVPPSKIVEGIYPRCYLFNMQTDERLSFIRKYEGPSTMKLIDYIVNFNCVYVYMPTWRDTGDDFIRQYGFDFGKVNEIMMGQNSLFILKMHPDSKLRFDDEYSNIVILDKDMDIYPILPFTHCLITDFSSIYFDYILMEDKKVILFLPDYDDYIKKNRALKYNYDEVMKGIVARDFRELITILKVNVDDYLMPELGSIRRTFWNPRYKDMSQLVNAIELKMS